MEENLYQKLTFDQYRKKFIGKTQIGSGTYGDVYQAQTIDKQIVAIKQFKDRNSHQQAIKEVAIMKELAHKNILGVLGFYQVKMAFEKFVLVTQFCQKGDLIKCRDYLDTLNNLEKLDICLQIVKGVFWMHQKNYMHRDIKPQNILLTADRTAKICDFGFGKTHISMQQSMKVGTPLYSDPLISTGQYSKKCDIFSVGLVIIYIFIGRNLFEGSKNLMQLDQKHKIYYSNPKKYLKSFGINQNLHNLLIKMLAKQDSNRINSEQVLIQLKSIIRNQSNKQILQKYKKINQGKQISLIYNQQNIFFKQLLNQRNTINSKLLVIKNQQKLWQYLTEKKQIIQKIKYLQNFSKLQTYKKYYLLFLISFQYVRILIIYQKYLKKQLNQDQQIKNLLKQCSQQFYKELKNYIDFEKQKWKNILLNASAQLSSILPIINDNISQYGQQLIKQISNSSLMNIMNYNPKDIRQQYTKFFLDYCLLKNQFNQKNKQQYITIRDLLNNL